MQKKHVIWVKKLFLFWNNTLTFPASSGLEGSYPKIPLKRRRSKLKNIHALISRGIPGGAQYIITSPFGNSKLVRIWKKRAPNQQYKWTY